ncbi:MAG TPA: D-glycero-beta-D-manno-heptose 1-phosphate adenylyltransferase [Tepidisphaeraceae bacterium]|jgi:D-beta-D-heptose 7-phosphate kinase/D-beta-D-heptose 1-phosphate adenosyltransferase|nr:D-glycero-beta-D-manno-heptose 1-phosphate adenylyltransferase [Tepidisphaeraceae bacterium]
MSTRLIELVERLPGHPAVLLGDLMVDRYLYGNAERLSPEAPVPVIHYQKEEYRLGGAGSVAADLAVLGATVRVVGLVGNDDMATLARKKLAEHGCDDQYLVETPGRCTVCKMRLVGAAQHRHPQQMIRLDYEDSSPISPEIGRQVLAKLSTALDGASVLCIEDYNKGLLTEEVCRGAIKLARERNIPVIVDPALVADYAKYAGATAIKLNRTETEKITKLPLRQESDYAPAANWLLEKLNLQAAIITLDKNGSYVVARDGTSRWLQTRPRQVYDVTGAGDMVLATVSLARAAGATWEESVILGNVAGGLEVEKFGSIPITRDEIVHELMSEVDQRDGKQRTLEQLLPELNRHRNAGKKIVFTNGCFDLIHLGHVKYFQYAKSQGDLLVVGVNTDASIRGLKGDKRPIISEEDRISVLEELESIDYLVPFGDETPMRLIQSIRPDVLVKGADYKKEQVVGWDFVESCGGHVALAPLIHGKSTSAVIQRILDAYK